MTPHPLQILATTAHDHLARHAFDNASDQQLADAFCRDLGAITRATLPERWPGEREVRGLRHAATVFGTEPADDLDALHAAARVSFAQVRWSEYYEEDNWSALFLSEFANGEGIGPNGRLGHDSVILGLFLLGPHTTYPAHAHPAEEFYIVLSGDPSFQVGADAEFTEKSPGDVILHHSDMPHAIRTGEAPFFAVFGWRGAISEPGWYRDDMGDDSLPVKWPKVLKD